MKLHSGTVDGGRFAALIPAAGYSSRMGLFKPLLPLGRSLVIERTISTFKRAGLEDIRVVTGHKHELLVPLLNRLGVKAIRNPDFDKGMYSSIEAGIRTLDDTTDAFFLLPGDCPLVAPASIHALMEAYRRNPAVVIYPVHEGSRGHPPLISVHLGTLIKDHDPKNGLKSLLEQNVHIFQEVPVEDPNIHVDLDTIPDYKSYCGVECMHFPSENECLRLLQSAVVGENIVHHSAEVARIAVSISEHLNSRGGIINLGYVMAAGFLHDIAGDTIDHAQKGKEIVFELGYKAVADIIALHMDIPSHMITTINEAAIIYLADKMVDGSSIVSVEERFYNALRKYGEDSAIRETIRRRFENACEIKQTIETALNCRLEDILQTGTMFGNDQPPPRAICA